MISKLELELNKLEVLSEASCISICLPRVLVWVITVFDWLVLVGNSIDFQGSDEIIDLFRWIFCRVLASPCISMKGMHDR